MGVNYIEPIIFLSGTLTRSNIGDTKSYNKAT